MGWRYQNRKKPFGLQYFPLISSCLCKTSVWNRIKTCIFNDAPLRCRNIYVLSTKTPIVDLRTVTFNTSITLLLKSDNIVEGHIWKIFGSPTSPFNVERRPYWGKQQFQQLHSKAFFPLTYRLQELHRKCVNCWHSHLSTCYWISLANCIKTVQK